MCVQAHVLVCIYIMHFYCSDVVMELSREIVLFGSEVLNSLWITLLEQLRINGIIVKEVWYRSALIHHNSGSDLFALSFD